MAFTEQEKNRVLHFLGYAPWQSLASSIQLGYPSASQPLFLLYDSFNRLTPDGENSVRTDLCNCEDIERQMSEARGRMKAIKLGTLEVNPRETAMLRQELSYWKKRLADDLGVVPNPYSQMEYLGSGGGINSKVHG